MSYYKGPSWAVAPVDQSNNKKNASSSSSSQPLEWILIEIKSGVEVARHNLSSRPFTLLGRDADACSIVLQHESCSRIHARIAFDGMTGVPWLRDLQSTHGTTVNKKKLPPMACGKQESMSTKTGARGVVLYPSDVLQFGASTRLYCLEGPEEFARGAKKLLQKQQEANRLIGVAGDDPTASATSTGDELMKQQKQAQEKKDETGVSWGIDMDDHPDDSQMDENDKNQAVNLLLDESMIPERHRKEWDRLRALRYKLENVQEESGRILRKGPREDLTEGQERQLLRNQERQVTLQHDIQEKEQVLYRKIFPDHQVAAASRRRQSRDQWSVSYAEDDEVEDRTGDEARRIQEGLVVAAAADNRTSRRNNDDDDDAEDEQSLRAKRSSLLEKQRTIQARIAQALETSSMLQARIQRLQAAGDGEECFFVQNDLDIANESLSKGQKEQTAVNKLLAQTERLLKIVNPKIDFNETTTSIISTNSTSIAAAEPTMTMTDSPAAELLMPAPSIIPAPPPPPHARKREQPSLVGGDATSGAVTAKDSGVVETISLLPPPPPPKRPRVLGPSMPPPPSTSTTATDSTQVEQKRPRPKGSTLEVLSVSLPTTTTTTTALSSSSSSSSHVPKAHTQKGAPTKTTTTTTTSSAEKPLVALTMDDVKHDQWVKPKDQDGSGMTKLNKKFAGRY